MTVRLFLIAAAVVAVSACGQSTPVTGPTSSQAQSVDNSPAPSAPSSVTVAIEGGAAETLNPDPVTISHGMQVNFVNDDRIAHVLTADDGSWSSGNLDSEATFTRTFPSAGTFRYHDAANPQIAGTIVVQ